MGLPRLVQSLTDPRAYPEKPAEVELRQTHVSYIFLTPEFVYKIKKPVNFGFLDFTTLSKRRHYCAEEVRLNRRLTEGVYLDVVAITEKNDGFTMGGKDRAVEYAVKMKRLSEESMLTSLLERNAVTPDGIERVARRIAGFHREADSDKHISEFGSLKAIKKNTDENFLQTSDQRGITLSGGLYDRIKTYTRKFLADHRDLFHERIRGGFIRDCHGDIHCDHISITEGINIFDCIEFNERFRYSDVVADIAFLSMDLDYRNRNDLARILDREYFRETGDKGGEKLLDFYKCYRAYVRGKVDGFKYSEPEVTGPEKTDALLSSRAHYHLAGLYASGGFRPMLVVVCGMSGTGKSTVASTLVEKTGMARISSDAVRKELAGISPEMHARSEYETGIYTKEFTERTYREMNRQARAYLGSGRSVILDATFTDRAYLEDVRLWANKEGAEFQVIECTAPDRVIRERLATRPAEVGISPGGAVSDAGWEIYLEQKSRSKPIGMEYLSIDTSLGTEAALVEVSKYVFG